MISHDWSKWVNLMSLSTNPKSCAWHLHWLHFVLPPSSLWLPSGKLTYEKMVIYSLFAHKKWWFSIVMLVPNAAAPWQLVTNPPFFFRVWGGGGKLRSLWTCSRHVCFVNFGVWVGWDVKVPVNLLTSCMLRELRGLGGVGGYVKVPVNLLTWCMLGELRVCLGYIYIYTHNITQWRSHLDTYICK